ncbi:MULTISPECIES: DoxX family protein [unclassified Variovorax]|uniref:DoxX family protein n=2 Tax=Variovorax TaxID=34072 RepID=UPI000C9CF02B|nr:MULTISPECIES: DoxX family protein [unclassified Variovorax]PNG52880.1 Inner membrane protein YphA [Variovorax sp. B4]PNG55417.1 Inner membrane protein YphA [Variovorax sp. B2]VTV09185.1 Inner membrane protein YphA [Variovorax sp. WDL1]
MSTSTTTASTFAAPATASTAQDTLALLGRVLIALLFVPAGFGKLTGFAGVVGYIGSVGLPLPQLGAVIAIVVELGVGLMFLVGYKTRIAAVVLAVFTVAASFFFHNYWGMPADKAFVNQLMFFKNIAVAGGLLAFAAYGAGRFSIDKR